MIGNRVDHRQPATGVPAGGWSTSDGTEPGVATVGTDAGRAGVAVNGLPGPERDGAGRLRRLAPGVLLSFAAAALAFGAHQFVNVSPLIIAIVLGVLVANLVRLPAAFRPGIDLTATRVLRLGIVVLGLELSLADIAGLGGPVLVVVVAIVAGGIFGTLLLGRLLRVRKRLTLLIACGFSICGAAAVAGAAGVTDPRGEHEEDTVTAVALVVVFGTVMIAVVPAVAGGLDLSEHLAGRWAGGSIHEIAQVVAAGGIVGGAALTVAVMVKLARVLLMAPIMVVLSIRQRHRMRAAATAEGRTTAMAEGETATEQTAARTLPPIVPPFVLGFLAMIAIASFVPLPEVVAQAGTQLRTVLLSAAMFALGCGVRLRRLAGIGVRPLLLALGSTVLVAAIALGGMVLVA